MRATGSLPGPRAVSSLVGLHLSYSIETTEAGEGLEHLYESNDQSSLVPGYEATTGLQSVHNGYHSALLILSTKKIFSTSYVPLWCAVLTVSFLFSMEYTRKLLSQCPPVTSSLLLGERTNRWGEIARSWANGPPTYCHFDLEKRQQVSDRARTACVTVPVKVSVGVKLEGEWSVSAV